MRPKLLIVYAVIFFTSKAGLAQHGQYQFLNIDIDKGLSNNQVNCIYKDKRGFMWFGTMSGLDKYNGYTFKVFKRDTRNPHSLNDDCIVNICEGPEAKLWIETRNGFNIYDPLTEQFEHDLIPEEQSLHLPNYGLSSIKKDNKGNYWFLYANDGVYKYDPLRHKTWHFSHTFNKSLYSDIVMGIDEDKQGNMWFIYHDGVLEKFNTFQQKVTFRSDLLSKANVAANYNYSLTVDRDNDLWLYSRNSSLGVYYFSPDKHTFMHLDKTTSGARLNTNIINNITQDDKGIIWVATDHGGINLIDKKDFSVRYLLNREDDSKSIAQNSGVVYKDDMGIMWFGTYKRGISYYHKNIIKFPVYRHFASDVNSLSFEDVNKFVEDDLGNLWIGTNGGGLTYFNRKTGRYTQYKHETGNTNSLSNDVIISLCIDHQKKLWIGTYFGGLDCFDGRTFTHYRHNDRDSTTISDDRVWSILEDSGNRLWIGTFTGGLNMLDRSKNIFKHYKPFQPNSVHSAFISSIFEDRDRNIWFGSYYGVDVLLKKNNRFIHYIHEDKNPNSLNMDNVTSINQDSRGLMWISTLEGLNIFDPARNKFSVLSKENGLPDNMVLNTLEDNNHTIWLSTPKGLCNITLTPFNGSYRYQFKSFDETDGLQGREFNVNAALKTKRGEMIFGGAKGFNMFLPENIGYVESAPMPALADFQMFNKTLNPGEAVNGHVVLSKSITETSDLALRYNENSFSIGFADLNFFNSGKVKLEYKLDGFDKAWIKNDDKTRKATYTNIDPGNYVFKVRAVSNNGSLTSLPLTLPIRIQPPFWKTRFAYLLYLLTCLTSLWYIRQRGIKKIEAKFELEREREEARRMHELDLMKIEFFTNVSHEFRTPISLILAPVECMLKEADDKSNHRKLQMIYQNSKRLLNMINQLLDFSKLSLQKFKIDLKEADIIKNIRDTCDLFSTLADKKQIRFGFECETDSCMAFFDEDKIERILFNLVSNALKFTHESGCVNVTVKLLESNMADMTLLEIHVKDTGIGIPAEKHDKIFERFFQNIMPASMINQGSGIGLAITKEFVNLMGGVISVESEPGKGSSFIVRLPLKLSKELNRNEANIPSMSFQLIKTEPVVYEKKDKRITILIVEDNPEFRTYLKEDLNRSYNVVEAANGRDGWQKALSLHPNLILSDINMPEINGIDFCKKIRSDKRTEHIPFILLTAFTAGEQELIGLETGANDYMIKPFNFEVLHFKIKNLLKYQQSTKETYQKQIEVEPSAVVIEGPDMKFMKKALAVIEANISNADFSVEMLSREVNMSRVALYRKVFNLLGKAPLEFIKSIRLKRAMQLLEMNEFTIAEVAYQVGYNNPKYFAKAFKSEFSILPSDYLNELKKNK
ncbi:Signal transduction histidine kinase [Mucilaginibacter lappiensis]|uniref:histidine kinase n=1 Tax=Mucilaginibacter lappiensis TaxID=354630 RepID=A0ABR6PT06_9SPHI|nr:two-component regulator propeller domain-containing protein [Mucilaginibacter lappiensis]MBB6112912.1 signal transduction histidine kinase/ligand-binding sensor domain-containing protein/DNA-binding response OmpR family regulator [Mucilaginibacter lappiensis]SIS09179.1 Signal transduction histidine kinase [Mucilaginibacter lappiensis]